MGRLPPPLKGSVGNVCYFQSPCKAWPSDGCEKHYSPCLHNSDSLPYMQSKYYIKVSVLRTHDSGGVSLFVTYICKKLLVVVASWLNCPIVTLWTTTSVKLLFRKALESAPKFNLLIKNTPSFIPLAVSVTLLKGNRLCFCDLFHWKCQL